MEKNFWPIGTIVKIKDVPDYRFMIIALLVEGSKGEIRDYVAVKYPSGALVQDDYFYFNHEQIEEVIFKGFDCEDHYVYVKLLNSIRKNKLENMR